MSYEAPINHTLQTHAVITRYNGKTFNLGRIDNKKWAPRAWFYRFVIFKLDRIKEKI